eukprot:IDg16536t1
MSSYPWLWHSKTSSGEEAAAATANRFPFMQHHCYANDQHSTLFVASFLFGAVETTVMTDLGADENLTPSYDADQIRRILEIDAFSNRWTICTKMCTEKKGGANLDSSGGTTSNSTCEIESAAQHSLPLHHGRRQQAILAFRSDERPGTICKRATAGRGVQAHLDSDAAQPAHAVVISARIAVSVSSGDVGYVDHDNHRCCSYPRRRALLSVRACRPCRSSAVTIRCI